MLELVVLYFVWLAISFGAGFIAIKFIGGVDEGQ